MVNLLNLNQTLPIPGYFDPVYPTTPFPQLSQAQRCVCLNFLAIWILRMRGLHSFANLAAPNLLQHFPTQGITLKTQIASETAYFCVVVESFHAMQRWTCLDLQSFIVNLCGYSTHLVRLSGTKQVAQPIIEVYLSQCFQKFKLITEYN